MGWLTRRKIKQFIADPDSVLIVNPRFCEHVFVDDVCRFCNVSKEYIDSGYWTWEEAFKNKKEDDIIIYDKGLYKLLNQGNEDE